MNGEMNNTERTEVLRQAVATDEARATFAESWAALINEVMPYESSVRNIFTVEVVPPGTWPVYQTDVQPISAWVMPKMGSVPMNLIEVDEVSVPTFEVVGSAYYKLRDARQGRVAVVDRTMMRLKDSIVEMEEDSGWAVIRTAATADPTRVVTLAVGETGLEKTVLDRAFSIMEAERGYGVTDIYLNSTNLAAIRSWTQTTIDPVTQREIFVNAGLPGIYGAQFHVLSTLADDEVYLFDQSEDGKFGYMPIRQELVTYDDPTAIKELRVGTIAYEEIGFAALNNLAVVKIDLS